jgi:hypothetical protein
MISLPDYKTIVELIKKGATIEAQEMIMSLREAAVDLKEENVALREKVKELEEALKVSGELSWDGRAYWRRQTNTDQKDGPFCQACYDKERKLVRLQSGALGNLPAWRCNVCASAVPKEAKL